MPKIERPKKNVEIRYDHKNVFDELLVKDPLLVHIERMDEKSWWMGITLPGKLGRINVTWIGTVPHVEIER